MPETWRMDGITESITLMVTAAEWRWLHRHMLFLRWRRVRSLRRWNKGHPRCR